jgi:hypothetical protein
MYLPVPADIHMLANGADLSFFKMGILNSQERPYAFVDLEG